MITNRSSFSGLYIARSGIVTAQGNLDVTGQNITNINTNGYTRQRLDIRSIGDSGYKSKYSNQGVKIGYGVEATGIQQLRDASLDARYRTENAEYGYEDVFVSGLNDLQGILDESINEGLQAQLSEVMTSFESLLSDASGAEYINVVKNNIQLVNKLFNEISGNVETIFRQNVEDLQMEVDNVNMILEKIANLNDLIRTDKLVGNSALELMDERNLLLDELSGIMDIRYQVDAEDYEAMSIYLMDSNGNKHILVDNEDFVEFELRPSADEIGRGTNISINIKNEEYTYTYAENGAILTQDKNEHYIETVPPTQSIYVFGDDMENGSLGAYLDLLNADGDPENRGIEYYMERLDTLANTFAKMINDINRGSLFDANGKLQITEDHLQEILSSDNQYLYTENGDVFDMDLLREAVFGTADIFPKYFMDENGVLLKDAAGEYISAKAGSIYLGTDGKYYTKKTPGYDLAFPKVNLADENIEAARVYNNGKDYISEKQYKALQNLDKDSYHQIMDEFKVSANLPAEYVRFQYGTSGKAHLLKDYNGDYVAVNDDGTLPTIYEITVSGQEEVEYCTADQLATYTAAKEAAGITFSAKELDSKKVIGARVYDDGNGNYLIDGEFSLLQDEFENYQSVPDEYYADANGNLITGYGGGYVKATDANGNLLTIFQDKDNPAAGVYFTQAERDAYLASRVTFAQSTTHSWVNAYSDGENIITADVYNGYSAIDKAKFTQLPNQYAVDNTGAFLQDVNGGYIRQNIIYNDDGTIDHYDTPVVFLGSDGYYYTEDVKDAYIADTTEFEQVPAASLAATKVYDGNGKL
ncbi:MAG: hypothetical protein IKM15_02645, partial [Peptococcaceae bacterium]|nr:hypothetical protein [Peptococcaceae bacterium]